MKWFDRASTPTSRTDDLIYERHPRYVEPAATPPVGTPEQYRRSLAEKYELPPWFSRLVLPLSGFAHTVNTFRENPKQLEHALRTVNTRTPLYSLPSLSATFILEDEDRPCSALDRAARLVAAAYRFYEEIKGGTAAPDVFRDSPMEMGQYRNLFGTCIYPAGSTLNVYKAELDTYIVVCYQGRMYRLDIADQSGFKGDGEISRGLRSIVEHGERAHEPYPVGVLSCGNWLRRRRNALTLRRHETNRRSLDVLSNALFVLCLDLDQNPDTHADAAFLVHSGNAHNRWHYASTQLVVFGNARAGGILSFSCTIDGNTMARFGSELKNRAQAGERPHENDDTAPALPPPEELHWQVSRAAWRKTHAEHLKAICYQPVYYEINGMGDELFRPRGIRSDAVVNLAVLLTARELVGHTPKILEHVSLAAYRNMGVNMASIKTPEACRFVEAVRDPDFDREATYPLLVAALRANEARIREARSLTDTIPLLMLHAQMASAFRKPFVFALLMAVMRMEIITSQPKLAEGVAFISRAGACLTYVSCFGLHYHIRDDKVVLALMPAQRQAFAAQAFGPAVHQNMKLIASILAEGTSATHSGIAAGAAKRSSTRSRCSSSIQTNTRCLAREKAT